jgi:hypothetical protein
MGIRSSIQHLLGHSAPASESDAVEQLHDAALQDVELLREAITELEYRLLEADEAGWVVAGDGARFDFSRDFLQRIIHQSRLHALKHPLVKRTVKLYDLYVFGQGISISAQGPVNEVVQRFLDNPKNKATFSSHNARTKLNRTLVVDGSLFFRFFVNASTGAVTVRTVAVDQILKPVRNPDDDAEVWFWLRRWWDAEGTLQEVLYPTLAYRPTVRPASYAGYRVEWDTPVYALTVGEFASMDFGVPEIYASLDWAKAYKQHLEDWKKLVRSLTRYAFQLKTKGKQKAVDAAQRKLDSTFGQSSGETNPAPTAGGTFVSGEDVDLQPVKTGGATITADDGRRLLHMATDGLPETFFGDASVGSLATSKSLDRPTELRFVEYQTLWGEAFADILSFVIDCAARAANGLLHSYNAGEDPELVIVRLDGEDADGRAVTRAVDVDWPPILQRDVKEQVDALVDGLTLKGRTAKVLDDAKLVERLLLTYLGEDDVEAILSRLHPADGEEPDTIPIAKPAPEPTPQTADDDQASEDRLAEALERLAPLLRELPLR